MAEQGIENGFGVALEMSGAKPAISQCIASLAMGGKLAMLWVFLPGRWNSTGRS